MRLKLEEQDRTITCSMLYENSRDYMPIAIADAEIFDSNLNDSFTYSPALLLPPAVRYISPDHKTIMFERPPGFVTYQLTNEMQDDLEADAKSRFTYRLPLPWQRYIVLLSADNMIANLFMFFANTELTSMANDPLCLPPICNFYNTGRLCLASFVDQPEYDHSISGVIDRVFDMVWNSGFNYDTILSLNTCFQHIRAIGKYKNNITDFYQYWSSLTLSDVLKWSYPVVYDSVNKFMGSGQLQYEYTGDAHDILLKIALAVQ